MPPRASCARQYPIDRPLPRSYRLREAWGTISRLARCGPARFLARARGVAAGPIVGATLAAVSAMLTACSDKPTPPSPAPAANTAKQDAHLAAEWQAAASELVASQRKIIGLLSDEDKLKPAERQAANHVAHRIFHEAQDRTARVKQSVREATAKGDGALPAVDALLTQIESEPDWFDADRLAVKELLVALRAGLAQSQSLNGIKAHKRASEDLEAIADIEQNYEREMKAVFGRFDARAMELKRERWDAYVAKVRALYSREQLLRDYAVVLPSADALKTAKEKGELTGTELPPKTLLLTFDDGPHAAYTDEILAILKQFGAKAVFFQVGRNLGDVGADGKPTLSPRAAVSRRILADGHVLANHSFSHAQLSQQSGPALVAEIAKADVLLKAVSADRSTLFRFPYGARNEEGLNALQGQQLRSMMWNIDSRDWADPVPSSIADRVLKAVKSEGRGIVLFHDIHERTVKALPLVLEQLRAEGYQFASWTPNGVVVADAKGGAQPAPMQPTVATYRNSWALVVGVNQYSAWPKLSSAVQDANAIQDSLSLTLGFPPPNIISLRDGDATRQRILAAFRELQNKVGKDDRVFVFFAGHGATRKLASGRTLGYIVPQDAALNALESDAIAMTELQNLADALPARHVFFVMDACYSGLGLTRGASDRFMRDNMRRVGRQMLTAGGADQLVADSGPAGHSVFTWTLLQALGGRADSNADGYITATEIAAFVAPTVANISQQTPAFGSLPGSEGGEFVFARPSEVEDLSSASAQLKDDAIRFNAKLATAPTKPEAKPPSKVTVAGLGGEKTTLVVPTASAQEPRQLAQQANDVGLKLYREKRYAEAEAAFADALKYWPDYAQAANNLGFVYFKQNRDAEAARWFEATIAKDPSRAVAYLNLGDAYINLRQMDKARKALETYISIAPHEVARRDGQRRLNVLNAAKPNPPTSP